MKMNILSGETISQIHQRITVKFTYGEISFVATKEGDKITYADDNPDVPQQVKDFIESWWKEEF